MNKRIRSKNTSILFAGSVALLLATVGCSTIAPPANSAADPSGAVPDAIHASLEGAAIDALVEARRVTRAADVRRMRVGSIVAREGHFEWVEPTRAASTSHPVVRIEIDPAHAATYIVHPRTGDAEVDRYHEGVTDREKRLVDEVDPLHRPIFVLTPRGRILAYGLGKVAIEVADRAQVARWVKGEPRDTSQGDLAVAAAD